MAQLNAPDSVVVDSAGNAYIADYANHIIRKVDASGNISTIAGLPTKKGYSGDGGPASAALLTSPSSISADASGNLYFIDGSCHVIRKISTNGIIATVAGNCGPFPIGPAAGDGSAATSFGLSSVGVTVDASGNNIYIAEYGGGRIRKVTNGIITTIAQNNGTTPLWAPGRLSVGASGTVYISDISSGGIGYVLKLTPALTSGAVVSVVAGGVPLNYTGTSYGDNGPATSADLGQPVGVVVDPAGNIYVADSFNNAIRKVAPNGIITTLAGGPHPGGGGFSGDGGQATSALLNFPTGITLSQSGTIYFADTSNNRIRIVGALPVSPSPQPSSFTLVDPVPQGANKSMLFGAQITTAATAATAQPGQPYLADLSLGRSVQGVATDGVAQVVIQIPATSVGQQITVDFAPNTCAAPGSPQCIDEYGYIFDPTTFDPTISGSLFSDTLPQIPVVVSAVSTASGPMAFVAFRAPSDFVRPDSPTANDASAAQRTVSITINGVTAAKNIVLIRPPVIFIHGFAVDASSWSSFTPLVADSSHFSVYLVDYGKPLYSATIGNCLTGACWQYEPTTEIDIVNTLPAIDLAVIHQNARQSHLGFTYNTSDVAEQIVSFLTRFALGDNPASIAAASVGADIVAHSMGGLIARYWAVEPDYLADGNFNKGYIHKLITLGTPHFGSPLSILTLFPESECARNIGANRGRLSFSSALFANGTFAHGAAGELNGDGIGANLSSELAILRGHGPTVPLAMLAGELGDIEGHIDISAPAKFVHSWCGSGDPLAKLYTSGTFDLIFDPGITSVNPTGNNTPRSNDGAVPLTSALMNQGIVTTALCGPNQCFSNYAHGEGTASLLAYGFGANYLVDSSGLVASQVQALLNTPVTVAATWSSK